jgi:hypothetical protein
VSKSGRDRLIYEEIRSTLAMAKKAEIEAADESTLDDIAR